MAEDPLANGVETRLWTKAADAAGFDPDVGPAMVQYGGTKLYGSDPDDLEKCIDRISKAIQNHANIQTSIDIKYLYSLCRREFPVGQKIFRVLLNREARLGSIDYVRCLSENGRVFRLVVGAARVEEFRSQLSEIKEMSRSSETVKVRTVQDRFFPDRDKGTWFVALNLLHRASYLGFLLQYDKWSFIVPEALSNAQSNIGRRVVTPHLRRLA